MNKLIIPIIVITVTALGIGAFFILTKPAFPERQQESISPASQKAQETPAKTQTTTQGVGLKSLAAARGIRIGSFRQYDIPSDAYDSIFKQEFNAATVGFFWDGIFHQGSNEFLFSETDKEVSWAASNAMEILGQTLVWFEDIPDWVKAKPLIEIEPLMNENIDTLVKRYAGRIKLWNVVNEAVDNDGNIRLDNKWAEAMGTDYIDKAFTRAHAADPKAILYYNDFDIESNEAKYNGVKALLKDLLSKGVPVHALGWQMHVKPDGFDPVTLLARMNEIADMGLDNYITELDVELPERAVAADYEAQKQTYKMVINVFLKARRHKILVIWGLRDKDPNWLTNNHPLLFDEKFQKKPAYDGVREALLGQ